MDQQQRPSIQATDTPTVVVFDSINRTFQPGAPLTSDELRTLDPEVDAPYGYVRFQDGPMLQVGTNGTSLEVVLQVLIERLEGYQRGPFPCVENRLALLAGKAMLAALDWRTMNRRIDGTEGLNFPHLRRVYPGDLADYVGALQLELQKALDEGIMP